MSVLFLVVFFFADSFDQKHTAYSIQNHNRLSHGERWARVKERMRVLILSAGFCISANYNDGDADGFLWDAPLSVNSGIVYDIWATPHWNARKTMTAIKCANCLAFSNYRFPMKAQMYQNVRMSFFPTLLFFHETHSSFCWRYIIQKSQGSIVFATCFMVT